MLLKCTLKKHKIHSQILLHFANVNLTDEGQYIEQLISWPKNHAER